MARYTVLYSIQLMLLALEVLCEYCQGFVEAGTITGLRFPDTHLLVMGHAAREGIHPACEAPALHRDRVLELPLPVLDAVHLPQGHGTNQDKFTASMSSN